MKIHFLFASLLFAGCSFVNPYSITFTTPNEAVIDPAVNTLDFVVSQPTLAYLSYVQCGDKEAFKLLPVVAETALPAQAYNLSLDVLKDEVPGTLCRLEVTAFDESTTSTASEALDVYVLEKAQEEVTEEVSEEALPAEEVLPVEEVPLEEPLPEVNE
jgi:hypothetical protein